jgi:hypothetical protein
MARRLAWARALAVDISPLRDSVAFRALWGGQIISRIGTQMRIVAVPFQVFQITESPAAVGLIGLAEVVPLIVFSIVGGALVDAMDRRKLMAFCQLALLLNSAALAVLSLSDRPSLVWIYILVAMGGAVTAVDQPARNAMSPTLVRPDQLPAAMALRQVVQQVTHVVGPALGGLLIAALNGVAALYVIDAATFLAGLVTLRWLPSGRPAPSESTAEGRITFGAIREGLSYAFRTPVLLGIFFVDFVAMVFGMPRAVFPALAETTFDAGATALGLLYAAPSAGALVAALTTGWVGRLRRPGRAILVSAAGWGAAITLAGLSLFSFPLTLFWLAVAGAADVISAVFRATVLVEATPDALLGRVSALNLMVVSSGPRLGDVEAGLVAELVGVGPSIVLGGAVCVAGTSVVAASFPSLRAHRARAGAQRARAE